MENLKRVILCKYGEVALKGANRPQFEHIMLSDLRHKAKRVGNFEIYAAQSTVYVEPLDEFADIDEMFEEAKHTFGFSGITVAAVAEKTLEDILRVAVEYLPQFLTGGVSFRAVAKRADKKFPMKSPELAGEVGSALLEAVPGLKVDLKNPDVTVTVEIREKGAYLHANQVRGAGGLPLGSNGRATLLLSGGIDSPVAGFMIMKRGVFVDAVHFESYPYTSEEALDKVLKLAEILTDYCGSMRVHVISVTHIQEELRDKCEEDYFTLLLRRFMMKLAERTAVETGAMALITGESLGQVASQTMQAITVTDAMCSIPVLRPCIGMDKEDIIEISRKINAYETSILPFEDCCTVFTPPHPRTRPEIEKVEAQEAKVDFDALCEEAWSSRRLFVVRRGREPMDVTERQA